MLRSRSSEVWHHANRCQYFGGTCCLILKVEERRNTYLKMEMVGSPETWVPVSLTGACQPNYMASHSWKTMIFMDILCQSHPCHCELNLIWTYVGSGEASCFSNKDFKITEMRSLIESFTSVTIDSWQVTCTTERRSRNICGRQMRSRTWSPSSFDYITVSLTTKLQVVTR
jgi:hypothetical protein